MSRIFVLLLLVAVCEAVNKTTATLMWSRGCTGLPKPAEEIIIWNENSPPAYPGGPPSYAPAIWIYVGNTFMGAGRSDLAFGCSPSVNPGLQCGLTGTYKGLCPEDFSGTIDYATSCDCEWLFNPSDTGPTELVILTCAMTNAAEPTKNGVCAYAYQGPQPGWSNQFKYVHPNQQKQQIVHAI